MIQYYNVADHLFSIEGKEKTLILLSNYAPFRVPATDEELLFSLSIADKAWSESQAVDAMHVFTDSSDDDMPRIEIYRCGQTTDGHNDALSDNDQRDWLFQVSLSKESPVCARFICTHDYHSARLWIDTKDTRFAIDNAAMLLFAFASAKQRTLEMHASVTVRHGKGYLFLGHSGTGKSTHSRQWLAAFSDARLLNDDNPIVRLWGDGADTQVIVYGSPWSGKTPCYINDAYPVGGIVKLSQAPHNQLRTLPLPEAYAYMLSSSSGLKISPSTMDALYETISTLIQTIPLYGMECLPDADAAHVCYEGMQRQ